MAAEYNGKRVGGARAAEVALTLRALAALLLLGRVDLIEPDARLRPLQRTGAAKPTVIVGLLDFILAYESTTMDFAARAGLDLDVV